MSMLTDLEKRFGAGCLERNPLLGQTVHCALCAEKHELHWNNETNESLVARQLCFNCGFWDDHLKADAAEDKKRFVIVKGTHYLISRDDPQNYRWSGFGGSKFIIKFHDGRIVTSRNLWCQSAIPHHFRDKMPDNAVFLTEEEYKQQEETK